MNGKNSTEVLLPIEEERAKIRAQRLKIGAALLVSNLFVYLLASNSPEKNPHVRLQHPGYFRLVLPIKAYLPLDTNAPEIQADLVGQGTTLRGVYLHPEEGQTSEEDGEAKSILVEVPAAFMPHITHQGPGAFAAYPAQHRSQAPRARGGPHEIKL